MKFKVLLRLLTEGLKVPDLMKKLLTSTFTYQIDLTTCRWDIMMKDINKLFPHLPKSGESFITSLSKRFNNKNTDDDDSVPSMIGEWSDWTIYNGSIFILTMEGKLRKDSDRAAFFMKIACLNTKKDVSNLHHLLYVLARRYDVYSDNNAKRYISVIGDVYTSETKNNRRTLDTVFIPSDTKAMIVDSIRKFMDNKQWYVEHSIPYHFGLLLYGPPGTGKSSIIKALTEEFDANVMYIQGRYITKAFSDNTGGWLHNVNDSVKPSFVIIEDVDKCQAFRKPREYVDGMLATKESIEEDNDLAKMMLGTVMNVIDGLNSPENVIWIFTTNHIDELEPAIIRPGRIDLKVEIGYITNETFNEFLIHHFGKGLPNGYEVGGGYTFAQIQTDVMTGKSFDEIIQKYCDQN